MNNNELALKNRITLLQSRKRDNGKIIAKLNRKLRNLNKE